MGRPRAPLPSQGRTGPRRARSSVVPPHVAAPPPLPPRRRPERRRARARGRPRVRLAVAAPVPRRGAAGRHRRRAGRGRPAIVVAGDDRQARDLAADLRAWLRPRPVRFYPSRGVAYESHLAPPPHLVGLRVAALDALLAATGRPRRRAAGRRRLRRRAVARRSPTRRCARTPSRCARATCSTSTRSPADLVAAGYERVDQVEDRGQFAIRGGILDVYPATEDRAVRVDLFDIEIESLRWFSTFTQRSLGDADAVEIAPAAELAAEHRELAEIAALSDDEDRPDVAELLPVDRFHAFLDLAPAGRARSLIAAEEEVAPALADHWQDVCAAFHDDDAHHLYVAPEDVARRARRARAASGCRSHLRRPAARVPRPGRRRRRPLAARRPSPSSRSSCARATARSSPGRAAARASARPTTSRACRRAGWTRRPCSAPTRRARSCASPRRRCATASSPPACSSRCIPEHRLFRRRRAERTGGQDAGRRRRGALRSFADLRTGDIVVHEDHGLARFAGFDTKTVGGRHARLPRARVRRAPTRSSCRSTSSRRSRRYVGAGGAHPPLSKLGGKRWETIKARARRAAQELAGELLNLYAERKPPRRATPSPRTPTGSASSRRGSRGTETRRPARGDRARQGRHGGARSRWTA